MATAKKDDLGQAEVQQKIDKEQEQGFRGRKVDPRPNSDYSLESGPDSPPVIEVEAEALEQRAKAVRDSTKEA